MNMSERDKQDQLTGMFKNDSLLPGGVPFTPNIFTNPIFGGLTPRVSASYILGAQPQPPLPLYQSALFGTSQNAVPNTQPLTNAPLLAPSCSKYQKIVEIQDIDGIDASPEEKVFLYRMRELSKSYKEFMQKLQNTQIESVDLAATRFSDQRYKQLYENSCLLDKQLDDVMAHYFLKNLHKNPNLSEHVDTLKVQRENCKSLLRSLEQRLTLRLGQYYNVKDFKLQIEGLPQNVVLDCFSSPCIFDFILQFVELHQGNPVPAAIYLPNLYRILGNKNESEMQRIKTTYNPSDFSQLFTLILKKYYNSSHVMAILESRQAEIGPLSQANAFEEFREELSKSSNHLAVINVCTSWVKLLQRTIQKESLQAHLLNGPYSTRTLGSLQRHFIPSEMAKILPSMNFMPQEQQFQMLVDMYKTNHDMVQKYCTSFVPEIDLDFTEIDDDDVDPSFVKYTDESDNEVNQQDDFHCDNQEEDPLNELDPCEDQFDGY